LLYSRLVAVVGLFAVLTTVDGCSKSPSQPDGTPAGTQKTENYTGTLNPRETKAFSFKVAAPGEITVTITNLSPISGLTMGLRIGAWESATSTCPEQVFSDTARLNLVLHGNPQGASEYCVAIYDVGNLQAATNFALTVTHF
jgi:hypothetical protein